MLTSDALVIPKDAPNASFLYTEQLNRLFQIARNISLTQTSTRAILHGDKAGNIDGKWIVFTSDATADVENIISHGLKRIPVGYIIGEADKACSLYDGTTDWTDTTLSLKVDVSSVTLKVLVF
jgi:hypothetical protein